MNEKGMPGGFEGWWVVVERDGFLWKYETRKYESSPYNTPVWGSVNANDFHMYLTEKSARRAAKRYINRWERKQARRVSKGGAFDV